MGNVEIITAWGKLKTPFMYKEVVGMRNVKVYLKNWLELISKLLKVNIKNDSHMHNI